MNRLVDWLLRLFPREFRDTFGPELHALMISIGLLASYVPARRASSVDPVEALRME